MARWRELEELATFADLPEELWPSDDESRERVEARHRWLKERELPVVDFLSWWRARSALASKRPPPRRRWLSPGELARLDEERERGGERW